MKKAKKKWYQVRKKSKRYYMTRSREKSADLYKSNDPKFWKSIFETQTGNSNSIFGLRDKKGTLQTSPAGMAKVASAHYGALATPTEKPHFNKEFQREALELSHNYGPGLEKLDKQITLCDIAKARKRIKHGKACGPDEIYGESLKCGKDATDRILLPLFKMCFDAGTKTKHLHWPAASRRLGSKSSLRPTARPSYHTHFKL